MLNLLSKKVSSAAFTQFTDAITKLVHSQKRMEGAYLHHKEAWDAISIPISKDVGFATFSTISTLFTSAFQHLTRLPMMAKEIHKNFTKEGDLNKGPSGTLVETTVGMAKDLNKRVAALERMVDIPEHVTHELRGPGRHALVTL